MVSMSVLTPHKYAVAEQAESATCASVQYVFVPLKNAFQYYSIVSLVIRTITT